MHRRVGQLPGERTQELADFGVVTFDAEHGARLIDEPVRVLTGATQAEQGQVLDQMRDPRGQERLVSRADAHGQGCSQWAENRHPDSRNTVHLSLAHIGHERRIPAHTAAQMISPGALRRRARTGRRSAVASSLIPTARRLDSGIRVAPLARSADRFAELISLRSERDGCARLVARWRRLLADDGEESASM